MSSHSTPRTDREVAWEAPALAQLRENLRLTPAERLAIAEALLVFALSTPNYTPKPTDPIVRPATDRPPGSPPS